MRLVSIVLATGCAGSPPSAPGSQTPEATVVAPVEEEPSAPVDAPTPAADPPASVATTAGPPAGFRPRAMKRAPKLETQRGPEALYILGGPYEDLAKRTRTRAKQYLRRNYGADYDKEMIMAEVGEPADGATWIHFGLTEWSDGDFALALQRDDGWYTTPPLAHSSKNYAASVDSVAAAPVVLGPDGFEATEYTIAFATRYTTGPFTVKLVCVDVGPVACSRPWLAEVQRGGRKKRGEPMFTASTQYPGDGTIVIEETFRAKKFADDPEGYQRPHSVVGTFRPLEAAE
ncbi:MAG: hypothetical protein AAF721_05330 [Myxococcota bacterium]